ncbi:hypothetical protein BGZ65_009913 [Modicella reniformis]|uniref:Uncharacterized protein n=1 Tax=Modicella reniformis TaxID=1440133 RepID=A0A9P6M7V2_9FUNG|nr:hypothetical protein BGZ65_009913 [Modicella reniformis]
MLPQEEALGLLQNYIRKAAVVDKIAAAERALAKAIDVQKSGDTQYYGKFCFTENRTSMPESAKRAIQTIAHDAYVASVQQQKLSELRGLRHDLSEGLAKQRVSELSAALVHVNNLEGEVESLKHALQHRLKTTALMFKHNITQLRETALATKVSEAFQKKIKDMKNNNQKKTSPTPGKGQPTKKGPVKTKGKGSQGKKKPQASSKKGSPSQKAQDTSIPPDILTLLNKGVNFNLHLKFNLNNFDQEIHSLRAKLGQQYSSMKRKQDF